MESLRFGNAILLSVSPPADPDSRIEWRQIPPMTKLDYSRFVLKELHHHIATPHALIVQADGFVLRPDLWEDGWLQFDYIGAPWPPQLRVGKYVLEPCCRVGNGGFSLRSKRLLEMTSPIDMSTLHFPSVSEDLVICHVLHDYLTGRGIRFADIDTAARFAIEAPVSSTHRLGECFGFHGRRHLAGLTAAEA